MFCRYNLKILGSPKARQIMTDLADNIKTQFSQYALDVCTIFTYEEFQYDLSIALGQECVQFPVLPISRYVTLDR